MMEDKNSIWLDSALKTHSRLTESVITVFENLLKANSIDFLAVTGRTKDKKSALEKITRKGYKKPEVQMTDLSGVRVILYFESDVDRVSNLISDSFGVDKNNSLDKSKVLSKDQIGYRSVHFVCTLGNKRATLPEYSKLTDLKFEVQVRTVLQHAWAELAHDSNYKFSGSLPPEIERKLYLYAGMLEIADKGFDELSSQIDLYKQSIDEKSKLGDYTATIDSISLKEYFGFWVEENGITLSSDIIQNNTSELIRELNSFGVNTLEDLITIIPKGYVEAYKEVGERSNVFGIVRDWMLITNWQKFLDNVSFNWVVDSDALKLLGKFITGENLTNMLKALDEHDALILDEHDEEDIG
ncbi:GTP pyrophosphokinase [Shewanella xiamenensis]|uniref:GTP pyrophosphokinase n=1 Tax=Shewanella TaxID=22 RepID=UPI000A81CFE8|nr:MULTISPECIES: GTP pyrophosphokinase [Shewanella]MCT8868125.1 GTP pyrophosphokinase [Shewanella xiamenensis]